MDRLRPEDATFEDLVRRAQQQPPTQLAPLPGAQPDLGQVWRQWLVDKVARPAGEFVGQKWEALPDPAKQAIEGANFWMDTGMREVGRPVGGITHYEMARIAALAERGDPGAQLLWNIARATNQGINTGMAMTGDPYANDRMRAGFGAGIYDPGATDPVGRASVPEIRDRILEAYEAERRAHRERSAAGGMNPYQGYESGLEPARAAWQAAYENDPLDQFMAELVVDPLNWTGTAVAEKLAAQGTFAGARALGATPMVAGRASRTAVNALKAIDAAQAMPITVPWTGVKAVAHATPAGRWVTERALAVSNRSNLAQARSRVMTAVENQMAAGATDSISRLRTVAYETAKNAPDPAAAFATWTSPEVYRTWTMAVADKNTPIMAAAEQDLIRRKLIMMVKGKPRLSTRLNFHLQIDDVLQANAFGDVDTETLHDLADAFAFAAYKNNPSKYSNNIANVYSTLKFYAVPQIAGAPGAQGAFKPKYGISIAGGANPSTLPHELAHWFQWQAAPRTQQTILNDLGQPTLTPAGGEQIAEGIENFLMDVPLNQVTRPESNWALAQYRATVDASYLRGRRPGELQAPTRQEVLDAFNGITARSGGGGGAAAAPPVAPGAPGAVGAQATTGAPVPAAAAAPGPPAPVGGTAPTTGGLQPATLSSGQPNPGWSQAFAEANTVAMNHPDVVALERQERALDAQSQALAQRLGNQDSPEIDALTNQRNAIVKQKIARRNQVHDEAMIERGYQTLDQADAALAATRAAPPPSPIARVTTPPVPAVPPTVPLPSGTGAGAAAAPAPAAAADRPFQTRWDNSKGRWVRRYLDTGEVDDTIPQAVVDPSTRTMYQMAPGATPPSEPGGVPKLVVTNNAELNDYVNTHFQTGDASMPLSHHNAPDSLAKDGMQQVWVSTSVNGGAGGTNVGGTVASGTTHDLVYHGVVEASPGDPTSSFHVYDVVPKGSAKAAWDLADESDVPWVDGEGWAVDDTPLEGQAPKAVSPPAASLPAVTPHVLTQQEQAILNSFSDLPTTTQKTLALQDHDWYEEIAPKYGGPGGLSADKIAADGYTQLESTYQLADDAVEVGGAHTFELDNIEDGIYTYNIVPYQGIPFSPVPTNAAPFGLYTSPNAVTQPTYQPGNQAPALWANQIAQNDPNPLVITSMDDLMAVKGVLNLPLDEPIPLSALNSLGHMSIQIPAGGPSVSDVVNQLDTSEAYGGSTHLSYSNMAVGTPTLNIGWLKSPAVQSVEAGIPTPTLATVYPGIFAQSYFGGMYPVPGAYQYFSPNFVGTDLLNSWSATHAHPNATATAPWVSVKKLLDDGIGIIETATVDNQNTLIARLISDAPGIQVVYGKHGATGAPVIMFVANDIPSLPSSFVHEGTLSNWTPPPAAAVTQAAPGTPVALPALPTYLTHTYPKVFTGTALYPDANSTVHLSPSELDTWVQLYPGASDVPDDPRISVAKVLDAGYGIIETDDNTALINLVDRLLIDDPNVSVTWGMWFDTQVAIIHGKGYDFASANGMFTSDGMKMLDASGDEVFVPPSPAAMPAPGAWNQPVEHPVNSTEDIEALHVLAANDEGLIDPITLHVWLVGHGKTGLTFANDDLLAEFHGLTAMTPDGWYSNTTYGTDGTMSLEYKPYGADDIDEMVTSIKQQPSAAGKEMEYADLWLGPDAGKYDAPPDPYTGDPAYSVTKLMDDGITKITFPGGAGVDELLAFHGDLQDIPPGVKKISFTDHDPPLIEFVKDQDDDLLEQVPWTEDEAGASAPGAATAVNPALEHEIYTVHSLDQLIEQDSVVPHPTNPGVYLINADSLHDAGYRAIALYKNVNVDLHAVPGAQYKLYLAADNATYAYFEIDSATSPTYGSDMPQYLHEKSLGMHEQGGETPASVTAAPAPHPADAVFKPDGTPVFGNQFYFGGMGDPGAAPGYSDLSWMASNHAFVGAAKNPDGETVENGIALSKLIAKNLAEFNADSTEVLDSFWKQLVNDYDMGITAYYLPSGALHTGNTADPMVVVVKSSVTPEQITQKYGVEPKWVKGGQSDHIVGFTAPVSHPVTSASWEWKITTPESVVAGPGSNFVPPPSAAAPMSPYGIPYTMPPSTGHLVYTLPPGGSTPLTLPASLGELAGTGYGAIDLLGVGQLEQFRTTVSPLGVSNLKGKRYHVPGPPATMRYVYTWDPPNHPGGTPSTAAWPDLEPSDNYLQWMAAQSPQTGTSPPTPHIPTPAVPALEIKNFGDVKALLNENGKIDIDALTATHPVIRVAANVRDYWEKRLVFATKHAKSTPSSVTVDGTQWLQYGKPVPLASPTVAHLQTEADVDALLKTTHDQGAFDALQVFKQYQKVYVEPEVVGYFRSKLPGANGGPLWHGAESVDPETGLDVWTKTPVISQAISDYGHTNREVKYTLAGRPQTPFGISAEVDEPAATAQYAAHQDLSQQAVTRLTADEVRAMIETHRGSDYEAIKKWQRDRIESPHLGWPRARLIEFDRHIASAYEKAPRLREDITVFRGDKQDDFDTALMAWYTAKTGDPLTVDRPAFISTSYKPSVSEGYARRNYKPGRNLMFRIEVPAGIKAWAVNSLHVPSGAPVPGLGITSGQIPLGTYGEWEYSFPPGSKFVIESSLARIRHRSNQNEVVLRMLDPESDEFRHATGDVVYQSPVPLVARGYVTPPGVADTPPLSAATAQQAVDAVAGDLRATPQQADAAGSMLQRLTSVLPQFHYDLLWSPQLPYRQHVERMIQATTNAERVAALRELGTSLNADFQTAGALLPGVLRWASSLFPNPTPNVGGTIGRSRFMSTLPDNQAELLNQVFSHPAVIAWKQKYDAAKAAVDTLVAAKGFTLTDMTTVRDILAFEKTLTPDEKKIIKAWLDAGGFVDPVRGHARQVYSSGVAQAWGEAVKAEFGVKDWVPPPPLAALAKAMKGFKSNWVAQAVATPANLLNNALDFTFKSVPEGINPMVGQSAWTFAQKLGILPPTAVYDPRSVMRGVGMSLDEMRTGGDPLLVERIPGYGKWISAHRDLSHAMESSARLSAWVHGMRVELDKGFDAFLGEASRQGNAALAESLAKAGPEVSADEVMRLAGEAGLAPNTISRLRDLRLRNILEASKKGEDLANKVHFNVLDERNIEAWLHMREIIPFHLWSTRNLAYYTATMAQHPWMLRTWLRYKQMSDDERERGGLTARFADKLPIPGADPLLRTLFGPNTLYFNPMLAMSITSQLRDIPEDRDATPIGKALQTANRYGLSLFPWIQIPLQALQTFGPDDEPGNVARLTGVINPALSLGASALAGRPTSIDIEAPIKAAVRGVQRGVPPISETRVGDIPVGGSRLIDYLVSKKLEEMSLTTMGVPNHPDYVVAMADPSDPLYQQAYMQVQWEALQQQGRGLFVSGTATLPDTEAAARYRAAQLRPALDALSPEDRHAATTALAKSGDLATTYWSASSDPRILQINAGLARGRDISRTPYSRIQDIDNQRRFLEYARYRQWLEGLPDAVQERSPADYVRAIP